jgi:hypothetical protein
MANKSKKISCSYRLESEVVQMIKTMALQENRNETNMLETMIKEYYKNNRRYGEMKNLSKNELIKIAMKEYNKMANNLGYDLSKEDNFKVVSEELNIEFSDRAYHIDNGQYVLKSGVESKHWVQYKDGTQYIIKNINFINPNKKFENKITIDYLV